MMGHSAAVLFALATMAATPGREVDSIGRDQLRAGQEFEIETADHVYRGQFVDRATGECRMQASLDGASFDPPRTVFMLGATAGPQARQMLVLMREVRVGLKMELGLGDLEPKNRLLTAKVEAIRILN
jgi:hypothetical protein